VHVQENDSLGRAPGFRRFGAPQEAIHIHIAEEFCEPLHVLGDQWTQNESWCFQINAEFAPPDVFEIHGPVNLPKSEYRSFLMCRRLPGGEYGSCVQRIRSNKRVLSYFFPSGVMPFRVTDIVFPSADTTRWSS